MYLEVIVVDICNFTLYLLSFIIAESYLIVPPYMFAFKNSVYLFKRKMYIHVYGAERDFLKQIPIRLHLYLSEY